jgi:hypothetical protein
VIVYAPLDTDEVVLPDRYAAARIVTDDATAIGPAYAVPTVSLGVEPSVVYRIVAPDVVVDSLTLCAPAYVPGGGMKFGAVTVPPPSVPGPPPQAANKMDRIRKERMLRRDLIMDTSIAITYFLLIKVYIVSYPIYLQSVSL